MRTGITDGQGLDRGSGRNLRYFYPPHFFRRPALRKDRTVVYICLGLSAIVPVVHGVRLPGWETQKHCMSLSWVVLTTILILLGFATYAAQIPEKWYPPRHDIFGASHQILHFMAIFAGLAHMRGLLRAFDYTHSQDFMCMIDR
ncbi:hemolysin-III related-domain-containing protein [Trichophaea hybrida]|nr:hemolysin-III related-domain-containing protein [Trichophaea hybrida]